MCIENHPEFIYAYFALAQLGAVSVPVNPAAKRFELRYYIEETKPALIITESRKLRDFKHDATFFYNSDNIIFIDTNTLSKPLLKQIENKEPCQSHEKTNTNDTATIIFTSAMDGYQRGAEITCANIYLTSKKCADTWFCEDDVMLSILPLFHPYGLITSLIIPLIGKKPFFLINKSDYNRSLNILNTEYVSIVSAVPAMYRLLSKVLPPATRFPDIRLWITGGESMSGHELQELRDKYDFNIRQGYGLTEASPIVTWNSPSEKNKLGSVGKPMPWNEINILKNDQFDEEGEVMVKGVNVIRGYLNRREAFISKLNHDWLATGDIGKIDGDGYLYITDRKKNMIIKNGLNIYPKEVERIIGYHPLVKDVHIEPNISNSGNHEKWETLKATVYQNSCANLDETALKMWCMENISMYKIPDKITIK